MKLLFLDCDGVLNNAIDSVSDYENLPNKRLHSKRCVELLNTITKETGAKIVVTSSWRIGHTSSKISDTLKDIGVIGEVIGVTNSINGEYIFRGNEILKWIQDHKCIINCEYYDYRDYVILDDDTDMLLWQKNNFVKCDPYVGLTDRNAKQAIAILNHKPCEDCGAEY